jgi:ribosomal protein S27E
MVASKTEWLCIQCGAVLGHVFGGEFYPDVPGKQLRTNGPNLVVTCPSCSHIKTFYTSDPVVRAMYQLVNAISDVAAKSMVAEMAKAINEQKK